MGIKFAPTPKPRKPRDLFKDFKNFARKLRCIVENEGSTGISHPLYANTNHDPSITHNAVATYISNTIEEISELNQMKHKKCPNNLTTAEKKAITTLRDKTDIIIKKADKSNTLVILNKAD